jgi:catechol 2,3-dioxygenase-like lactoylglutathione lyase family enzyme
VPESHAGRLFDHVHIRVADLDASRRFYEAALASLGHELRSGESYFTFDEFYVSSDGDPTSGVHLAFQAPDRETVERFFEAAMAAGGENNGRPGERDYHPGYYACYVRDPDGNNIEAVHHGPVERSAPSVVLSWDEPQERGADPCP